MDRSKKTTYYQNTTLKGYDLLIIQPKRGQKIVTRKDKPIQQIIQGQGDAHTMSPPTQTELVKLSQTKSRRAVTVKKGKNKARESKHRASYINDLYDAHLDWDMYEFDQDEYDIKISKPNKPRSKIAKVTRGPNYDIVKKQHSSETGAIMKPVAPKTDDVKNPTASKMAAYDDDDDDNESMCGLFGVYADSQDGVCFGEMMNVGV